MHVNLQKTYRLFGNPNRSGVLPFCNILFGFVLVFAVCMRLRMAFSLAGGVMGGRKQAENPFIRLFQDLIKFF